MELYDVILKRRSIRNYSAEPIPEEKLRRIIEAGLLAPTSRNRKPCEFYVVKDKAMLKRLSEVKPAGGAMLADCATAVVVAGDSDKADTWIEDSSIALSYMQLVAADLGVGSCWCQIRLRGSSSGSDAEGCVRGLLSVLDNYRIVGILALGMPENEPDQHSSCDANWSKVHYIPAD